MVSIRFQGLLDVARKGATATHILAVSYLNQTSVTAAREDTKHSALLTARNFVPLSLEMLGLTNSAGFTLISDLGQKLGFPDTNCNGFQ